MTYDLEGKVAAPESPEPRSGPGPISDGRAAAADVLAGVDGADVLVGQGADDARTIDRPMPGETVRIPTEAGERYVVAFDANAARVEVAGEDFVLIFPDGGRIVLLDLVENAGGANPPVLQIDGMDVAANLLVAQAMRLAESAPTLETAAAPPPLPTGTGGSVYSDNFGDILGLLDPLGVLAGTGLQFGLIEPVDGGADRLLASELVPGDDDEPRILAQDDEGRINPGGETIVDALANDSASDGGPLTIGGVEVVSGNGSARIVDGRIAYQSAIEDENSVVELRYTLGGGPEAASVFVTIGDYENVHAFYAAGDADFRNADGVVFETSISEQGPIAVEGLADAAQVDAALYPNESVTIQIQAAGISAPDMLDLYLIQDVSGSFEDDIAVIRGTVGDDSSPGDLSLLADLVAGVTARIADTNFGLGSFRDKLRPRGPDRPLEDFDDPHEFRSVLKLGGAGSPGGARLDGDADGPGYDDLQVEGGGGPRESQIKALSLVAEDAALASTDDPATTGSNLGFRLNAAKVAVIITDATSHEDVDRDVLRAQVLAAGIIPIFLVADGEEADELGFYEQLVDDLGVGAVVPLAADSSNLVDAITAGLTEVFPLTLQIEGDDNGYARIVSTETVNDVTTWTVELAAPADDAKAHGNDTITFRVTGEGGAQVGEEVVVSVDTTVEVPGTEEYDTLIGHNGEDIIIGDAGDDVLTGLGGADTFVFNLGTDDGNDRITDFDRAEDVLSFTDVTDQGIAGLDAADVDTEIVEIVNGGAGSDVTISFQTGGSLTLDGAGIGAAGSAIGSITALVDDANSQIQVA